MWPGDAGIQGWHILPAGTSLSDLELRLPGFEVYVCLMVSAAGNHHFVQGKSSNLCQLSFVTMSKGPWTSYLWVTINCFCVSTCCPESHMAHARISPDGFYCSFSDIYLWMNLLFVSRHLLLELVLRTGPLLKQRMNIKYIRFKFQFQLLGYHPKLSFVTCIFIPLFFKISIPTGVA